MIDMTLAEIATVVGGEVAGDPSVVVNGPAYVDSRSPQAGGLFVAIAGERVDGHAYADGSHAVLGSRPTSAPTVIVDDPIHALGLLARHVVDRLVADGLTVIALTGSQGKTSTKDLVAGILAIAAGAEAVVATAANHNNELGVPLTVLHAQESTRFLVVEMGARGIGHIAYLCAIVAPRVAAVLNVGTAHMSEFGSKEAIAQAKGEILEALPADGSAVLNADDPLVSSMADRTSAPVTTFGAGGADVRWSDVRLDERGRPSFDLHHGEVSASVTLMTSGAHQVANAAAATALAVGAGIPFDQAVRALPLVRAGSRWRMEITERSDGLLVINDTYNANPESTRAAVEALAAIGASGSRRTIAVLGEMRELGDSHVAGHRSVGSAAAEQGIDVVVVVGPEARGIGDAAAEAGREVVHTDGYAEAVAWLRQNAAAGDIVLVKASRGAALERIVERLLDDGPTTEPKETQK